MDKDFDIGRAPVPPLRAVPRSSKMPQQDGHIRGVASSSGGLIRATLGSAVAAGAILTLFWLPAEYGIDATGLGSVMGLTEMGEIKQQLYAEAKADDAAAVAQAASGITGSTTTSMANLQFLERLSRIEAQIAAIAAVVGSAPAARQLPLPPTQPAAVAPEAVAVMPAPARSAEPLASAWRDEVSYTLAPTEGVEVKLVMAKGAVAEFEWTANGAVLNYDTHGDGGGQGTLSYEQGRAVLDQAGELIAAFSGNHGWFWRNRTDVPVVLTLRTRGDYSQLKLP
jgi:hypothetical protein